MGFSTKYYDGVLKGQVELPFGEEAPPFDRERLRKTTFTGRIFTWAFEHPDWWLGFFRRFFPRVRWGKVVFLTRFEDVREVLERQDEFETPYGRELREFSGGFDFLLSLKDGKLYREQKSVVLSAFPPEEVDTRVRKIAVERSREIVSHAGEKFDAASELMRIVPVLICRDYYGLDIEDPRQFGDWAISINQILFGDWGADAVTRELAVAGAASLFATIDRSITIAEDAIKLGDEVDTPLGRLVRMAQSDKDNPFKRVMEIVHETNPQATDREVVRSIMVGMVVGFAPTNLLGGINCLDAVLSRPEIFDYIKRAIKDKDNTRLDKAILEAMRFKPHWIWPWRYASEAKTIGVKRGRPYSIPAGVAVLPATRSAMFDESVVNDPWAFNPDRSLSENMVFGVGIHRCIGAAIASVQIAEAFRALFEKPGFRRARGKEGKLTRLGPYPDRLMVEFDVPDENRLTEQSLVTVCARVQAGIDQKQLQKDVDGLGNPAIGAIKADLDKAGTIHFASLSIVPTGDSRKPDGDDLYLVLELSGDGTKHQVIEAFADAVHGHFVPLFERYAADPLKGTFEAFLLKHTVEVSPRYGSMAGLVFCGTPGHSVARIKAEQKLVKKAAEIVEENIWLKQDPKAPLSTSKAQISDNLSAAAILTKVRSGLKCKEFDWVFAPADSLLEKPGGTLLRALHHIVFNLRTAIPLAVLVAVFTWLTYLMQFDTSGSWFRTVARIGDSFILAVVGLTISAGALFAAVAFWLRSIERREEVSNAGIKLGLLEQLQKNEDALGYLQNHMTAVSVMKPGLLRWFLLGFSFYVISITARWAFRPGHLGDTGQIHFARWVRIPGTDRLVFFSNYGGSWESYLEDFVTKASAGLTAIWSNTKGFPRSRFLFLDGSRDGDRFKRWARAEQIPTSFWYSAYPKLNTTLIRKNSQIRQGLHSARASEARDWLSLFTSLPRQEGVKQSSLGKLLYQSEDTTVESLESGEIQSLIFGPLGSLPFAKMFAFEIDERNTTAAQRLKVLDHLVNHTSFGDTKPVGKAMFCVFGPNGLKRLGLTSSPNSDPLASFPMTFRQGMANEYRSRILDDQGDSAPEKWWWGSKETPVDLAILCYADCEEALNEMTLETASFSKTAGLIPRAVLPLEIGRDSPGCPVKSTAAKVAGSSRSKSVVSPLPYGEEERPPAREHFGFIDGISQPVIKGTRRRRNHNSSPIHQIAAGEFLFGYRDEYGYYPPSPTTPSEFDSEGRLLAIDADGKPVNSRSIVHDFGRNGSFVVIRQLAQDVEGFNTYCRMEADNLRSSGLAAYRAVDADWVGARIVGRWKDGSSLIRNPDKPGRELDNQFTYGAEDPQGLHCPLGAHIRRSNPRDSLGTDIDTQLRISKRHRILRVGRSYSLDNGADGKPEKGLLFICFNASFERQYEFIQQTWMSAQNFQGLRGEKDPLIGNQEIDLNGSAGRFTIPRWEGGVELTNLPSFVTTRGGGYFFMPSRAALQYLQSRLKPKDANDRVCAH
ncbi:cytochrome P450 [Mesorhizobium sp. 1M-11]|uniref:cytochrome P450 n=1 Tax=Mesorhizobium sp. 1M-11 TaxID=1529006 RepID=UPI0006C7668E|nr:cytochrome P450 [Mesorhizobium sp. 1M-11]